MHAMRRPPNVPLSINKDSLLNILSANVQSLKMYLVRCTKRREREKTFEKLSALAEHYLNSERDCMQSLCKSPRVWRMFDFDRS